MAEQNLAFSKIVSTPTPTAWSQAYSAGRLFAAFSLESKEEPTQGDNLSTLGKELISTFESEFFTLENKDLESIKSAIETTASRLSEEIKLSLIVCFFSEEILYLFALGGGKAVLKRAEKIGTVLEGDDGGVVKSSSGYVEDGDLIVLQTKQFLKVITPSVLTQSLDNNNPEEAAEELSPMVHERAEGGAAAIILVYNKEHFKEVSTVPQQTLNTTQEKEEGEKDEEAAADTEPIEDVDEELQPGDEQELKDTLPTPLSQPSPTTGFEKTSQADTSAFATERSRRKLPERISLGFLSGFLNWFRRLSGRRKITVIIAILLAVLIVVVSALALGSRGDGLRADFDEIYASAQTKYEEGQNLKDLNPQLAQDSFREALRILEANTDTFSQGSDQDRQIEELLERVRAEVTGDGGSVTASEVSASESKILSLAIENSKASYFTQNDDFVYFLNSAGVTRVDKGNDQEEELFDASWEAEGGIGLFGSNVYVLDKEDGILKFVPTDDGYSETDYFTGDPPDLSGAVDMTIDGSIYVLYGNGTINKYTRGAEDDFEVTGLPNNLSSPTRIFTNEGFDNIYILDRGNSRVVVIDKEGGFVNSYSADVIKNAREFDIDEESGRIFVLSGGKVYQIDI